MQATRNSVSCITCRKRKVKCDRVRPVCGQCLKGNRFCEGFEASSRLIVKDETIPVVRRCQSGTKQQFGNNSNASRVQFPAAADVETSSCFHQTVSRYQQIEYVDVNKSNARHSISKVHITPIHERDQVALSCCRKIISLMALKWIIADEMLVDLLPQMMSRSEALIWIIHANAVNYIGRAANTTVTPSQAWRYYNRALRSLQRDLYDPVLKASNETLCAVVLLAIFDILTNSNLGSWQAHVLGATSILACNGPDYYKPLSSPARILAKYIQGFDIIRVMTQGVDTMFGYPEWEHLAQGESAKPLDTLLFHVSKVANIIAQHEKFKSLSFEDIFTQLIAARNSIEEWKTSLPPYYTPKTVPIRASENIDDPDIYWSYPYIERLEYVTELVGYTMNSYRSLIIMIDRYLLGHMVPDADPTEKELTYYLWPVYLTGSMAKEIVMSLPSLYKSGSNFPLYPVLGASKVTTTENKIYIIYMLNKVSREVPVASLFARFVKVFEMFVPTEEQCRALFSRNLYCED